MIFKKNDLINEVLDTHFNSWAHTLNTADFVPKNYLNYIDKVIFYSLKQKLKEVDIYNLLYLKKLGYRLGLLDRLKIYFSGLEPMFELEFNAKQQAEEPRAEEPGDKKKDKLNNSYADKQ